MKQKYMIYTVALLLTFLHLNSQPLKIGEPFPYTHLLPADVKTPVIMDLFSSGCLVCFSSLPKLKTLQQDFEGQIQFILVGQLDDNIAKTYARFEKLYELNFPVAFDPAPLQSMKFSSFPQYIWIDHSRVVRAITGPDRIDAENIQQFLRYGTLNEPSTPIYNRNRLFLVNGNGGNDTNFVVRSLITRWQSPQPLYRISSPQKGRPVFQAIGLDLGELCKYAYLGFQYFHFKDSFYGVVSKDVIFEDIDTAIWKNARYCYSAMLPGTTADEAGFEEVLRQDLTRAFGAVGTLETRLMPYWRLVATSDTNLLSTRHNEPLTKFSHGGIYARCISMRRFVELLRRDNPRELPIIDETGILGRIDISIECIMSEIPDLQQALRTVGLDLVSGLRPMRTLVVRKQQKGLQYQYNCNP